LRDFDENEIVKIGILSTGIKLSSIGLNAEEARPRARNPGIGMTPTPLAPRSWIFREKVLSYFD
jgi:hypothetical protein